MKMTITPNNSYIYNAAFAGAMAGMIGNRNISDSNVADYLGVATAASVFALQLDSAWAALAPHPLPNQPNILDVSFLEEACEDFWTGRYNPAITTAQITQAAAAIAAALQEAETFANTNGIVVPGVGGASSSIPENWITSGLPGISGGIATQTGTGGQEVCVIAGALKARTTGKFRVDCHIQYSAGTTDANTKMTLYGIPVHNPASFFTGGIADLAALGSDVNPITPANWSQVLNVDAAGLTANAIQFNGTTLNVGTAGAFVICFRTQDTHTGFINGGDLSFDYSAIVGKDAAGDPLTIGDFFVVAACLQTHGNANTFNFGPAVIAIDER
jgi:hypothetical protein